MEQAVEIRTPDGVAPATLYWPDGPGAWPAVILYMDGLGIRPALHDMARRIAAAGYCALLPDLYYRGGAWTPIDPQEAFGKEGPARERMTREMGRLSLKVVAGDSAAFLDFLGQQKQVKGGARGKVGATGYCMGGAHVLTAAANHPDRIAAAAAIHSGRLATDQPDSPHLLAPRIKAKVYIGVAGIDPWLAPDETRRVEEAFAAAKADYRVELYPGATHGFAPSDTPVYDRAASERHWERLLDLFAATLR